MNLSANLSDTSALIIPDRSQAQIAGIGTDITRIVRIEQALARHGERFCQKILGEQELQKFKHRSAKVPARGVRFLATRFAAKEAFSKAIGLGIHMPMTWRAMQVLNAPSGAPQIVLNETLGAWYQQRFGAAHVTLTDEVDYAIAFVVIEKLSSRKDAL